MKSQTSVCLGTYTQIMEMGSLLFTEGLSMRGVKKDRKTGRTKETTELKKEEGER